MYVCICLLIGYACACVCVWPMTTVRACMPVCVCVWPMNGVGTTHAVFYRGAFPTSIHGMLVSSAPDNTPCSIIMRHHTPLGTQADKKSFFFFLLFSFSPYLSLSLCLPSKDIFFKPPFSSTGEIASTLNQLHSTSTSSVSL